MTLPDGFLLEQADQHPRRDRAHLPLRDARGRERWVEKPDHRDVVDPHEREVRRDTQARFACHAQGPQREEVVGREDRGRRRSQEALRGGVARVLGVRSSFRHQGGIGG